ncbi:TrmH family RNA methyltransferase [Flavobacteriaceae bacterium 14752]|uniref:TrmH family RNA methyltransferase n=1 Tax=Mesohalobacter salilacus TaxID=2491711 RepID=UPI000F63C231|nr:TrmH family RNA methyltransferase [Flavobacteriaceae bacterium 14752]
MQQLAHKDIVNKKNTLSIILVCDVLNSPANLGSLCRIAEAFGVAKLYINQTNKDFLKSNRFKKTARHTDQYLDLEFYTDFTQLFKTLKVEKYESVALEYCDKSVALPQIKFNEKTALVVGNEKSGVSETILNFVEKSTHIDMYGRSSSINVVQATAIALYECVNQQR